MKYNELGRTGLVVSQIGYGALPVGPSQANFPVDKGAAIIRHALESGINFLDTAQSYRTYPYLKAALEGWDKPVVINSKCADDSYEKMQAALDEAQAELGRMPDIFTLHAARAGVEVFEQRAGALDCLIDAKKKGLIKAVGLSSHSVKVVRLAAAHPDIDVIHPLINLAGMGILEGTRDEMRDAIAYAAAQGKGIYLMKALAGGHLGKNYREALLYSANVPGAAAMVVGMLNNAEIDANIAALEGREIDELTSSQLGIVKKKLIVLRQSCIGCGACEKTCPNFAIKVAADKKAAVDHDKCILCGYCVGKCPQFVLRLVSDSVG